MSLHPIASLPGDMEDATVAGTMAYTYITRSTSRTSSARNRLGNGGGGPLRSSSSEHPSTAGHSSAAAAPVVVSARTTSPAYRHNPYLASPTSETYLTLVSPESIALEDGEHTQSSNSRSIDVTSDRRLVVRSRSHRGISPSSRSASEGNRSRQRHLSPAFMNPLADHGRYAVDATTAAAAAAAAEPYLTRRDSAASLSCGNSYDAVLYSCADSSLASRHASPSPGHLTSLVHAPASPIASSPYARRRTESPSMSRHSHLDNSVSHGSPETSSLYYSFGNPSAGTGVGMSNNPYVGVRFTPEAPAALAMGHDGVSPYTSSLPQRHTALSRGPTNNSSVGGGDGHDAYRTPTTENPPSRVARAYPSTSFGATTPPQNSPGVVVLNESESIMSIASTYVNPSAAGAAAATATSSAAAAYAARPTDTPLSHHSDTPPPYNQPSSAPLSPDSTNMIVPPGHPAAMAMQRSGLPPYALTSDAARSDVSSSSQNSGAHHPYHYATPPHQPLQQQQQQQQQQYYGTGLPPLPSMPPSAATANASAGVSPPPPPPPPPYNGGVQFLHSMDSDASPQAFPPDPAAYDHYHANHAAAVLPGPPSYDNVSAVTDADTTDVLSDRAAPTQFRSLGAAVGSAAGSSASQDEEVKGTTTTTHGRVSMEGRDGQRKTAHAEGTFQTSMTSANGMTRTAPALPEMTSGGPASLLTNEEAAGADAVPQWKLTKTSEALPAAGTGSSASAANAAAFGVAAEASDDDEEDDGADAESSQAAAAGGKKARNNKKKKRARRNRKLRFLEDLPPATEMKFLPPPPPPLPAPYDMSTAAAQPSAGVDFDQYYGVLLRWYERILADEADFVGLNYPVLPPAMSTVNGSNQPQSNYNVNSNNGGGGMTSLDASHATLHNSGVLQTSSTFAPCTPGTVAGSTPGTTPSSTMFALTGFAAGTGAAAGATPPGSLAPRVRRTAGGGEVPVQCPRIEQYMPLCDIPAALAATAAASAPDGVGGVAGGENGRRFSLLSADSSVVHAVAAPSNVQAANGDHVGKTQFTAGRLHVQHVDRAVQWAKDLNSWWLCYIHPHSFTSRRQHIPQGFPLPASFPQPHPSSNMGSMYGWPPTSMVMTGYEGGQHFHGAAAASGGGGGGMGSGNVAMSVLSGTGSIAATMAPENAYSGMPVSNYSPYSIQSLAPPPPPPQPQQQYQHYQQQQQQHQHQHQQQHPSMMGIYTVYQ